MVSGRYGCWLVSVIEGRTARSSVCWFSASSYDTSISCRWFTIWTGPNWSLAADYIGDEIIGCSGKQWDVMGRTYWNDCWENGQSDLADRKLPFCVPAHILGLVVHFGTFGLLISCEVSACSAVMSIMCFLHLPHLPRLLTSITNAESINIWSDVPWPFKPQSGIFDTLRQASGWMFDHSSSWQNQCSPTDLLAF